MVKSNLRIVNDHGQVRIEGPLDIHHAAEAEKILAKMKGKQLDVSGVTRLDTAGAVLLSNYTARHKIKLAGLAQQFRPLMELIDISALKIPEKAEPASHLRLLIQHVGKNAIKIKGDTIEIISFFGKACVALVSAFARPAQIRYASVTYHIEHIGINAIPIVGLMAFLISVVLAYQGVAQLRPLGAEQFTVNLIAISVLREMGVLLTAIMVAGRSGSAFTAEIGVMKLREEVDALRAIGLNPFEILVVPRMIAMIIALPLLTFIANILGLLGGAVLSLSLIGISLPEFMDRVQQAANGETFFVGMIKAPVFAMAIAIVGCMHGMKVTGSSESVGRETTASVVKSIFLVLMLDALFSILFEKLGI